MAARWMRIDQTNLARHPTLTPNYAPPTTSGRD